MTTGTPRARRTRWAAVAAAAALALSACGGGDSGDGDDGTVIRWEATRVGVAGGRRFVSLLTASPEHDEGMVRSAGLSDVR